MVFPNEKIIYEIPIYSMPEKEFNQRWGKEKTSLIERSISMGKSAEKASEMIYNLYYPQYVWKYNQIVGFVEISISMKDVSLNIHRTLDKRMVAVSKTKHFIQELTPIHFPIKKMNNEELLTKIEEYLNIIQDDLPGMMCLYLDTFNIVKRYIDFLGIHAELFN